MKLVDLEDAVIEALEPLETTGLISGRDLWSDPPAAAVNLAAALGRKLPRVALMYAGGNMIRLGPGRYRHEPEYTLILAAQALRGNEAATRGPAGAGPEGGAYEILARVMAALDGQTLELDILPLSFGRVELLTWDTKILVYGVRLSTGFIWTVSEEAGEWSVLPPVIDFETFSRSGAAGEVVVAAADEGHTIEVYGVSAGLPGDNPVELIGSRSGSGLVDLNFSEFSLRLFGLFVPAPVTIFALARDAGGNYSPPSTLAGPSTLLTDGETEASGIRRSAAGTEIHFDISGLPSEDSFLAVFWQDQTTGEISAAGSAGNGQKTITGLRADRAYWFAGLPLNEGGQILLPPPLFESRAMVPGGGGFNDLLSALKAAIEADGRLAVYNEIVAIGKWRPDGFSLPAFERYGILISPEGETVETIAVNELQRVCRVNIVCFVQIWDEELSLIGVDEDEVGILQMSRDVFAALLDNDLGGVIELSGLELNSRTGLNQAHSRDRDRLYHEVKVEGIFRLRPFGG